VQRGPACRRTEGRPSKRVPEMDLSGCPLQANRYNAYSLNNVTAKKSDDGSVAVQFGGCRRQNSELLPIESGWNYMVRLYRPRAEILDGSWKLPEAQPIS
jgi:hypothetical protein